MNEERPHVIASLCFRDFMDNPDTITERLGIKPTVSYIPGSRTKNSRVVSRSFWSLTLFDGYCIDVGEQIEKSVKNLDERLINIVPDVGGEAYLGVGISFSNIYPSINIIPYVMARLSEFKINLDLDLFFLNNKNPS